MKKSGESTMIRGRYILAGIALIGAVSTVMRSSRSLYEPPVTFFAIDNRLSLAEQEQIASYIEHEHDVAPKELAQGLRQTFVEIASVGIVQSASGDRELDIRSKTPQARVNDERVVCDAGPLMPASVFNPAVLTQLPRLSYDERFVQHDHIADHLRTLHRRLTSSLYDRFAITWHEDTNILLHDKQHHDLRIIADLHTIPSAQQLAWCDAAYTTMREKQKTKPVVADIRFEKQIITYVQSAEGGK